METTTERRPTHWVEWIISGIFLIVVLKFGYTTLTVVGLIFTMIVLLIGAIMEGGDTLGEFEKKVANNNWVYYTMLWLMVSSFVIWLLGIDSVALPEMNPLKFVARQLKDAVIRPPADPYANDGFGGSITHFIFRNGGGWGKAALSFLLWTLFAYPISFWDEVKNHKKEIAIVAGILWVANTLSKRKK